MLTVNQFYLPAMVLTFIGAVVMDVYIVTQGVKFII